MIYPNLIAEHRAFWCLEAMARGADVTPELIDAVLEGKEPLMADEALRLAQYMMCKASYLFSTSLSVLNRKSNRHRRWMAGLERNLYEIYEASKEGDYWALDYLNTNKRIKYANMELRFQSGRQVIYAEYKAVKLDMEWALCHIREKQHKPRGLKGKVTI